MKKNCIKFNKENFIDGIDVANITTHTRKEIFAAEAKNHNPVIQYQIGKWIGNILSDEDKRLSLGWYEKSAAQNYGPALYELYIIYKKEDDKQELAFDYFKQALNLGYHEAVQKYVRLKNDQELPEEFPVYDEAELIKKVCEQGIYSWNEKYSFFERIDPYKNIRKINAHLYKMMFQVYDYVKEIKTQLDSFIKEGKTYYKNYEINCGIGFYPDEEYKTEDGTVFEGASCQWELIAKYKKPLPEKIKALSLWENFHFGPFEDLTHDYVCKAMYAFACPEKKKDSEDYCDYMVSMEILKQAKPEDFHISLEISFGKNRVVKNFTREEFHSRRDADYSKKLHIPSIWEFPLLRPMRILSQAKALLRIELEAADVKKQIFNDFSSIYKGDSDFFSKPHVHMDLCYGYKRPFGLKSKKDSMIEFDIQTMCGLNGISAGNLADDSNKADIPQWCEPFEFMTSPYNRHYLCFANHGIWDHCSLRADQILKLKPLNFGWFCSVWFDEFGE